MREVRHLLVTIAEIVIVVLLAIFAVGNIRADRYNFAGTSFAGNVWWTVVGSALLGFIFAALLLGPGRVSSGARGRGLSRQQEQELGGLRTENERLRGQYAQAVSERDQYRAALASAMPANQGTNQPVATTSQTNQRTAPDYVLTQRDGVSPDMQGQTATTPVAPMTQTDQTTTTPESGWRGAFRRRRDGGSAADETLMPDNTAAPTA
ncbi:MAG TPA: hypothetical protein VGR88_09600 [Ktedonobacterales bacterium]|nr:hypothetical protein [Ktedonobacterales bacterium]